MTLEHLMTGHVSPLQPDIIILPIDEQLEKDNSKVILVRLGINDSLQEKDKSDFEDDVIELILTARENNQVPVLCGLTHVNDPTAEKRRTAFNELIKKNCKATNVHFIDIGQVPFKPEDLPDGLHLNQAYSDRVNDYIINYLRENVFVKIDK
jgi:lysophospholipase L1-like esterase